MEKDKTAYNLAKDNVSSLTTRKMQLAKYLARNEKDFKEGVKPDINAIREGLEMLNELCAEKTTKKMAELSQNELDTFFTWAERKTPMQAA